MLGHPMAMRRFTRLTNAFSKKFENHVHMVALYTVWYNFVKGSAAGMSKTLWSMEDIANLVEAAAPAPAKRGPPRRASRRQGPPFYRIG